MRLWRRVRNRILGRARARAEADAERRLRGHAELWRLLSEYVARSQSTGSNHLDYWELYHLVRRHRPREVLECGTGVSTVVIAFALEENAGSGAPGRVTSMEDVPRWYEHARELLPARLAPRVELTLSPVVEVCHSIFRGVRYRDVPADRPYEMVYVDGPSYLAPSDGSVCFDADYLHVLTRSDMPVRALIDKRVSTAWVLQKLLGTEKVRYDARTHQCHVAPSTRHDLLGFDRREPSAAFRRSFRLRGPSRLELLFERRAGGMGGDR